MVTKVKLVGKGPFTSFLTSSMLLVSLTGVKELVRYSGRDIGFIAKHTLPLRATNYYSNHLVFNFLPVRKCVGHLFERTIILMQWEISKLLRFDFILQTFWFAQ